MEADLTKGQKKILLQFRRFIETDFFKDEVKRIRSELGLPNKGLKPTEEDLEKLHDLFRVPSNYPVIKDKTGGVLHILGLGHPLKPLNLEVRKLADLLPVNNLYLTALVKYYILYNRFFFDELTGLKHYFETANVCELQDAQSEFDEYGISDDPESGGFTIPAYLEMLERKLWRYPVVVRIHPDASQRDVIEFVKRNWAQIRAYQEEYAGRSKTASFKNSKTKENKDNRERNEFIYKHKDLTSSQIASLLAREKGIFLDAGHILKIISLEKSRREKK